jgi:hypothetical protein
MSIGGDLSRADLSRALDEVIEAMRLLTEEVCRCHITLLMIEGLMRGAEADARFYECVESISRGIKERARVRRYYE